MRINNNDTAFSVWSSYTKNVTGMKASMSRLSTGTIQNTDDPAGIGISERMRAQIKGTSMARQNTDNTISLFQTADSWMQKISDNVARMKTLATEAQGITSAADKANIQTEFKSMQDEITRITSQYTSAAKFNGIYLFRGGNGDAVINGDKVDTSSKIKVQIGADVNQTLELDLKDLQVTNTEVIGTVHAYTYSGTVINGSTHDSVGWNTIIDNTKMSVSSSNVIAKIDAAVTFVAKARASVAAQQKRVEASREGLLTYQDNLTSAESKIRDIDMASESTNFSKYQILTQAANAMLAQANSLPNSITQLLG